MKFTFDEEIDAANLENSLDDFVPTEEDRQWDAEDSNAQDDLYRKWARFYFRLGRSDGYSDLLFEHPLFSYESLEFLDAYRRGFSLGENELEVDEAMRETINAY